jgi:hypothetical protein
MRATREHIGATHARTRIQATNTPLSLLHTNMRLLLLLLAAVTAEDVGFRTISFFVGDVAKLDAGKKAYGGKDARGEFHSQFQQDRLMKTVIFTDAEQHPRFFIDLAANHPIFKSNTRALERDAGWQGLCVDGNEEFLMLLVKRRRCQVVGAIVTSATNDRVHFRRWLGAGNVGGQTGQWQHGLSGVVGYDNKEQQGQHAQMKASGGVTTRDFEGLTVKFSTLLETHNAPKEIGFLSLDVEGAEDAVLGDAFPWDQYTFLAMTIERPQPSLRKRLRAHGYHRVCTMAEDMIYVHKSFPGGVAAVVERVRAAAPKFVAMSNVTHDVSFS